MRSPNSYLDVVLLAVLVGLGGAALVLAVFLAAAAVR